MANSKLALVLIAQSISCLSAAAYAQEAAQNTPASVSSVPTSEGAATAAAIAKANADAAENAKAAAAAAAAPPAKPVISDEAKRKAKEYGFHAELFNGNTMYCREDAAIGTRFKTKRCIDAIQFEDYAVQLKIARDTMKADKACQGGGACGGLK